MASSSQNNLDESFDDRFDELFDQNFDQNFDQAFENFTIQDDQEEWRKKRKKRAYIERNREEGNVRLWNDYFSKTPTYPENYFRRRFRMNKTLFMHIVHRLSNEVPFFNKSKMLSEGIVSLFFKSLPQPFVSWRMVLPLIWSTNTSGSVKQQLGRVWKILWKV